MKIHLDLGRGRLACAGPFIRGRMLPLEEFHQAEISDREVCKKCLRNKIYKKYVEAIIDWANEKE